MMKFSHFLFRFVIRASKCICLSILMQIWQVLYDSTMTRFLTITWSNDEIFDFCLQIRDQRVKMDLYIDFYEDLTLNSITRCMTNFDPFFDHNLVKWWDIQIFSSDSWSGHENTYSCKFSCKSELFSYFF
jgi:hypothetical protein